MGILFYIFLSSLSFSNSAESLYASLIKKNSPQGSKEKEVIKITRKPASAIEQSETLGNEQMASSNLFYYLDNLSGCFVKQVVGEKETETSDEGVHNKIIEAREYSVRPGYYIFNLGGVKLITPKLCLTEIKIKK